MNERKRAINDIAEIPPNLSDEEMIDFLDEHGVSEEFLENTPEVPEYERPIPRTQPINVRFDNFTLSRLKVMADRKNVGYQTLLKTFVAERLYEEEKREGQPASTPTMPDADEQKSEPKKRDWQQQAFDFIKENESVIEDEDLDYIVSARVLGDASRLLLEISNEIKAASKKKNFPPARLKRMMKGYNKLKEFVDRAFAIHDEKFGLPEPREGGEREEAVTAEEDEEPEIDDADPPEPAPEGRGAKIISIEEALRNRQRAAM
jgi:hypothetical protein